MQFDESCEEFAIKKMIAQKRGINVPVINFHFVRNFGSCFYKQNKNGEMLC